MNPSMEHLLPKAEYMLLRLKAQEPENEKAIQAAQELVDDLKAEIAGGHE